VYFYIYRDSTTLYVLLGRSYFTKHLVNFNDNIEQCRIVTHHHARDTMIHTHLVNQTMMIDIVHLVIDIAKAVADEGEVEHQNENQVDIAAAVTGIIDQKALKNHTKEK
jgi:hypothetical protein